MRKTTIPANAHLRLLLLLSNRLSNSLMDIWADMRLDLHVCVRASAWLQNGTCTITAHLFLLDLYIVNLCILGAASRHSSNVYLSIAMMLDVSCMAICLSPIHLHSTRFNEPFFAASTFYYFFILFSSSLFYIACITCCCFFFCFC